MNLIDKILNEKYTGQYNAKYVLLHPAKKALLNQEAVLRSNAALFFGQVSHIEDMKVIWSDEIEENEILLTGEKESL